VGVTLLSATIQATFPDGRGVRAEDLKALEVETEDGVTSVQASGEPWTAGLISFPSILLTAFASHAEPSESFFAEAQRMLEMVARFLDRRTPQKIQRLTSQGMSLRVLIEIRIDQDQMELSLPPALLSACGRHAIEILIISND
jgi:hypothetical protein